MQIGPFHLSSSAHRLACSNRRMKEKAGCLYAVCLKSDGTVPTKYFTISAQGFQCRTPGIPAFPANFPFSQCHPCAEREALSTFSKRASRFKHVFLRCVHGQRELVAGKQREIKKAHSDQKPGVPCFRFSAQQQEYEQHCRCRKQKQKQMQPLKGRYSKFVHFTRRNVFPVFSSRNRLNSSTVPPVRVRLSRGCA